MLKPNQTQSETITSITYTLNATYSTSSLTFYPNGKISYEAESREVADARSIADSSQIPISAYHDLEKIVIDSGFLALVSQSDTNGLDDCDIHTISVSTKNKTKTVSYSGNFPKPFKDVYGKIMELWNAPLLRASY